MKTMRARLFAFLAGCLLGAMPFAQAAGPGDLLNGLLGRLAGSNTRLNPNDADYLNGRTAELRRLVANEQANDALALSAELIRWVSARVGPDDGALVTLYELRANAREPFVSLDDRNYAPAIADYQRALDIATNFDLLSKDARAQAMNRQLMNMGTLTLERTAVPGSVSYADARSYYERALQTAPSAKGEYWETRFLSQIYYARMACGARDLATCDRVYAEYRRDFGKRQLNVEDRLTVLNVEAALARLKGDDGAALAASQALVSWIRGNREPLTEERLSLLYEPVGALSGYGSRESANELHASILAAIDALRIDPRRVSGGWAHLVPAAYLNVARARVDLGDVNGAALLVDRTSAFLAASNSVSRQQDWELLELYASIAERSGRNEEVRRFLARIVDGGCASHVARLARLEALAGDGAAARRHLELGLTKLDREGCFDDWRYFAFAARTMALLDDVVAAIAFGKEAVLRSEDVRRTLRADQQQFDADFVVARSEIYLETAGWLIERGRGDEARYILDALRQRAAGELTRGGFDFAPLKAEALFRLDEIEWRRTLTKLVPGVLQKAFDALNRSANAPAPQAPESRSGTVPLARNDVEVIALPLPKSVRLSVRHASGPDETFEVPLDPARLTNLVIRTQTVTTNPGNASLEAATGKPLRELYDRLWAPIAARLPEAGAGTIYLSLYGELGQVPFAALDDGKQYLVERYELAVRVSGEPVPAAALSAARLAGFGADDAPPGFADLKFAVREAQTVVDTVGGTRGGNRLYRDRAFDRGSLLGALADAGVQRVHVASHFRLAATDLGASTLALGDGTTMSVEELAKAPIAAKSLIVLSACDTARPPLIRAANAVDSRDSVATVLRRRGARTVIASGWRVDDASAPDFMADFYRELAQPGTSTPAALRRAQLAFLHSDDAARRHPYYWAGFVTIGGE
ncbi:MAG TPA: CHAT domain-containing protein [Steroidobacteraceae bacterium]|nr:CHAT domain-containing protein [Steroidobacteraceae bacterium]